MLFIIKHKIGEGNMTTYDQSFDESQVTDIYFPEQFEKIPHAVLMDFLPEMIAESQSDMVKLETWKLHFINQGIPLAITKSPGKNGHIVKLWKERRV